MGGRHVLRQSSNPDWVRAFAARKAENCQLLEDREWRADTVAMHLESLADGRDEPPNSTTRIEAYLFDFAANQYRTVHDRMKCARPLGR